ncbi:MAG: hypothetical protein KatS3mg068_0173 [Candidatus Sericytochromatia bacterium]|nr:MAG: hypothetical protein KatS3mg068_0173 [Candidatus Sericytochromatia bacterium]
MYVSKAYEGRIHDYKLLNKEFPNDKDWFKNLVVIADLGYLGIEKDYKCKKIIMKDKKQKQKELTRSQKLNNKKKSKMRIKA